MHIGQVFRYGRPYSPEPELVEDLVNYFYATYTEGCKLPLLESGINRIETINAPEGKRRPAILISSSPHKIGSNENPWQDFFDPDNGHIRYNGDNKSPNVLAENAKGNKLLLEIFDVQNSNDPSIRYSSVPILFFKRVSFHGKVKGFVQFQGYGIIERIERVTQYDTKNSRHFSNYVFDFVVFNLNDEGERFDWNWISMRRNPNISLEETLKYAPSAWKNWIKHGAKELDKSRRRVSKLLISRSSEQQPIQGSREEQTLIKIFNYYSLKRANFEALAAIVAKRIFSTSSGKYIEGWITPKSSDGGSDFIGRLDLGTGFSKVKLVILGQAKCEKLNAPTNGRDIARTVARLKRGWIGVYVTTSYFSSSVQREIIDDEYPILLVHGLRLATEVLAICHELGYLEIEDLLSNLDSDYDQKIQTRRPEEILLM